MNCSHIFKEIDLLCEDYIGVWEDICNIESPSKYKAGVDAVGEYLMTLAKKLGFEIKRVYISLVCSMLAGRVVWGIARFSLSMVQKNTFGITAFISGAFTQAIPGIVLQLLLIRQTQHG